MAIADAAHRVLWLLPLIATALPMADCLRLAFVSDLHYDPFYGNAQAYTGDNSGCTTATATLGTQGCDSPLSLLVSAFDDVARAGKPEYVVLGGDWERHATIASAASAAFRTLASVISNFTLRAVPCPGITPLGNNDFVPDYVFDITAAQPPQLLGEITQHLSAVGLLRDDERGTFSTAGYYARRIANESLTILVINTLIWSKDLSPNVATGADPLGQFAFAVATITAARARGDKVLLLSHIPPTINFFGATRHEDDKAKASREYYFQPQYEATYAQILRNSSDVLVAQVFAHTHRFSFSASVDMGSVPLIILGAISPVYGNNPNYFIADYDHKLGRLTRMQQRYLPISTKGDSAAWTWGYTLPDAYGAALALGGMNAGYMQAVSAMISTNATARTVFAAMYGGGIDDDFSAFCWRLMACFTSTTAPLAVLDCGFAASTIAPASTQPLSPPPTSSPSSKPSAPSPPSPPSPTTTKAPGTAAPSGSSEVDVRIVVGVVVTAVGLSIFAVSFALLRRRRRAVIFEAVASGTQLN